MKIFSKFARIFLKNKKTFYFVFFFASLFFFLSPNSVHAGVGDLIMDGIGFGAYYFAIGINKITLMAIGVLTDVISYTNLTGDIEMIDTGWKVIRDFCNIFFVIALLFIAFATILNQENYSAKRLLPKLLIMAVLINFSKTFFSIIVDFSQVFLATFAQTFSSAPGLFADRFNMNDAFMVADKTKKIGSFDAAMTSIAALMASFVTLVVIVAMMFIFVIRIAFIWIYIILSPLVFLGMAFPPIRGYTEKIWKDFIQQVVIGPVLAFFVWLALVAGANSMTAVKGGDVAYMEQAQAAPTTEEFQGAATKFFGLKDLANYFIMVALMMGGMTMAMGIGGGVGNVAQGAMGWATGKRGFAANPIAWGRRTGAWGIRKGDEGLRAGASKVGYGMKQYGGAGASLLDSRLGSLVPGGKAKGGLVRTAYRLAKSPGEIFSNYLTNERVRKDALSDYEAKERNLKKERKQAEEKLQKAKQTGNIQEQDKAEEELKEVKEKQRNNALAFDGDNFKKNNLDDKFYKTNVKGDFVNEAGGEIFDKNDDGRYVDENGNVLSKEEIDKVLQVEGIVAKGKNFMGGEKELYAMNEAKADAWNAWRTSRSKAYAAKDQKEDEFVKKKSKEILDSNISPQAMIDKFKNSKILTKRERMALAKAISETKHLGLRGIQQSTVDEMLKVLDSNKSAVQEFKSNLLSSGFAGKLFDATSQKDVLAFQDAMSRGAITHLDKSFAESGDNLKMFKEGTDSQWEFEALANKFFGNKAGRESLEKGAKDALKKEKKELESKKEELASQGRDVSDFDDSALMDSQDSTKINSYRRLIAARGDITEAFEDVEPMDERLDEAMDDLIKNMSNKELDTIKRENFDSDYLQKEFGSKEKADKFKDAFEEAIAKNIGQVHLTAMQRRGDMDGEVLDNIKEIVGEGGEDKSDRRKAIEKRIENRKKTDEISVRARKEAEDSVEQFERYYDVDKRKSEFKSDIEAMEDEEKEARKKIINEIEKAKQDFLSDIEQFEKDIEKSQQLTGQAQKRKDGFQSDLEAIEEQEVSDENKEFVKNKIPDVIKDQIRKFNQIKEDFLAEVNEAKNKGRSEDEINEIRDKYFEELKKNRDGAEKLKQRLAELQEE